MRRWRGLNSSSPASANIGTQPAYRRRGLALVEHVLAEAYTAGMRTASLQSTPEGLPVYEALGFRPAGRYEEWLHATALTPSVMR